MVFMLRTVCGSLPGLGLPPPSLSGRVLWPIVTMISWKFGVQFLTVSTGLSGMWPVLMKFSIHGMDCTSEAAMASHSPQAHRERSSPVRSGLCQCLCVHIHPLRRLSRGMPLRSSVVGLLVCIPSWHCEKVVVVMLCLVLNSLIVLVAHIDGQSCGSYGEL